MDNQFLGFYQVAIKAQKQMVEEAWVAWEKKPAQDLYPNGFKDFLLEYLDEQVKEMYKKAGVAIPKEEGK
jgi:hypothetical protein